MQSTSISRRPGGVDTFSRSLKHRLSTRSKFVTDPAEVGRRTEREEVAYLKSMIGSSYDGRQFQGDTLSMLKRREQDCGVGIIESL